MRIFSLQNRDGATWFHRACAVLCLLLLMFSVAHTAVGHADGLMTAPSAVHNVQSVSADTPDTCAVCVAMATAVVLAVLAFTAPRLARPRPPVAVAVSLPVTGWHTCLFSRPPPVR
jgi:hypothetical protein